MPRKYTVEFENVTLAAASGDIDLFSLQAADDKPIAVTKVSLKTTSELAEAQEEWLRLRWVAGHTTVGSGGASATPKTLSVNDASASFSARTNDTTIASTGTARNIVSDAFQVRAGYVDEYAPEDWIWNTQAEFLVLRLVAAVADDVVANGTIWVVEVP